MDGASRLPHLIVSTTTKGSALSSRNPILSPHWLGAIDGWKGGAREPIKKEMGKGGGRREAGVGVGEELAGEGEMGVFMNTNLLGEL